MRKLLRVTAPTATAVAILTQSGGGWAVTHTAPSLAWMRNLDMAAIKQRLQATGAKWEWLPVSEQFAAIAAQTPQNAAKRVQRAKTTHSTVSAPNVESAPPSVPSVNADEGLALWLRGCANAVKAEARKKATVRNVRGKRKAVDNG